MTSEIRTNSADAKEILLHLETCDATFYPRLSERVELADYAVKLAQNATRFEAYSDGRLIGLVAAYCNAADRNTAFVSNVSVDPKQRGQGIARKLMFACIDHVGNLYFKRLSLEVDPTALAAIRLYRGLGFSEETDQPNGTLKMCLVLG